MDRSHARTLAGCYVIRYNFNKKKEKFGNNADAYGILSKDIEEANLELKDYRGSFFHRSGHINGQLLGP